MGQLLGLILSSSSFIPSSWDSSEIDEFKGTKSVPQSLQFEFKYVVPDE
jgi:hypothetical protein